MPDAYEVHDARLISDISGNSAVGGLNAVVGPVPEGKVWNILSAMIYVTVAETRNFWFSILSRAALSYPITTPASFALDPATSKYYPCLREGMEIKLFAGEQLIAYRDVATAGSTMNIYARYIETDLPLYEYIEPQIKRSLNRLASMSRRGGGGGRSELAIAPPAGPEGGGGRER